MKLPHPYTIIACAILALAFAHMPYGYYNFLRIAVCLYSIFLAISLWRPQQVNYRFLLYPSPYVFLYGKSEVLLKWVSDTRRTSPARCVSHNYF